VAHSYESFYRDISVWLAKVPVKQAFVFVHGYNVLFEDAVYRTAQLAYDLGFEGAPILYSWPSLGTEIGYPVDLNNAEWTAPQLRWFLEDVATKSSADVVHVIAHSMGNRPVVSALNRIAAESAAAVRSRFRQIVLTAPDIDAATFRQLAAALPRVGTRVTLYASSNDRALQLSHKYQGYPRAGDTVPRVVIVRGVDTVDVSALDTGLLGHSYYGDNRSVITDLLYLLRDGLEPSRRAFLQVRAEPPDRYWVFLR
jgi:esterase/lipase superfamily enzyme